MRTCLHSNLTHLFYAGIVGGVVGGIMLLLVITVIPILIVWCVHPKKKSVCCLYMLLHRQTQIDRTLHVKCCGNMAMVGCETITNVGKF